MFEIEAQTAKERKNMKWILTFALNTLIAHEAMAIKSNKQINMCVEAGKKKLVVKMICWYET